ncbi:hypothetical protein R3Q56_006709 [Pseudomonas aeruginosa]|nr:hypothetical protein [Pseudomonas aeruginosa]ELR2942337.1 hypothetical protein [Pseudomonas aeruginosa]
MEEHENYALFIDGKLHELIPLSHFNSRMGDYGVRNPEDVYRLVSGRAVRTLGKTYLAKPENTLTATLPVEKPSKPNTENQSKPKMRIEQDSPYAEDISALQKRSNRFARFGLLLAAVSVLSTIMAFAFSYCASALEPTNVIEQIQIPASISKFFGEHSSDVDQVSIAANNIESLFLSIFDSTIFRVIVGIGVICAIGTCVFRGSIAPLAGLVPLLIAPQIVTTLLFDAPETKDHSLSGSLLSAIEQAVESRNGSELERLLNPIKDLDEQGKTYLLAQVYASEGIRHQSVIESAQEIHAGHISPEGQIAFAIETVASNGDLGSLSSSAARYHQVATEEAETWKQLVVFPKIAGLIAAAGTLCFSLTALYIRRRLSTIFKLLEQIS